jgi:molecular chaperone DnaK
MLRNSSGELLTPSVVLFDRDETVVGREARKAQATMPESVAECAKRDMGREHYAHPINGQQIPPEVIQACVLRKLKEDTSAVLGPQFKCVITVPAYFDEPRRKATADAGEMAGLDVLNIVNEPTAAALAFGERLGYLAETGAPLEHLNVLVYDLGGGTFDVTMIELRPGEITTLATDGDVQLGGYDWDSRLVDYVTDQFQNRYQFDVRRDAGSMSRVRAAVEEAKHTLTLREEAALHISHQGMTLDLTISREQFEELTEDLLERTAYTTRQVLAASGLDWSQVSRILLVGGSSRMPMVTKMLTGLSGVKPDQSVNPDEAVARGAAIFADFLLCQSGERQAASRVQVVDVNAHSLGIEGINQATARKENTILIPRNTPLPHEKRRKFVTKEDNQRSVVVQVLEGESKVPDQCAMIGRAAIRNLPAGLPQGTQIVVRYRYETSGRLSVRAEVPGSGKEATIELERDRGISSAGVNRWKQLLASDGGFNAIQQTLNQIRQESTRSGQAPSVPVLQPANSGGATAAAQPLPLHSAAAPPAPGATPSIAPVPQPGTTSGRTASFKPNLAAIPAAAPQHPAPAVLSPQPAPLPSATSGAIANPPEKQDAPTRAAGPRKLPWWGHVAGHVGGAVLGLVIGYYILVWIKPSANFLNLSLPGMPPPAETTENGEPPTDAS